MKIERWLITSAATILVGLLISAAPNALEEKVLNIYTWSGYLPDTVIRAFEKETGIHINLSTFANNEALYAKLKANPELGYDIIMPSSYFISRMIKNQLIQPLDKSKLKHLQNLNPYFLNKSYDPNNIYSVPYLWNATGIVINRRYHDPKAVQSWQDLWSASYIKQLLLLDDTREIFSMALLTLHHSANSTDPKALQDAYLKLKALKKNVKLFNTDAQRSIYINEDLSLGMGLNGDLYLATLENSNLTFQYPKEGFVISLDCIVIPKKAKHPLNAHRFIDFVLQANIAKQISLESGFPTPNSAAQQALPLSLKKNSILYPNPKIMAKGQIQEDVGPAAMLYEHYFEMLKLE
jgi:spermidine/putrescine transport system substrate-binding protein